MMWEFNGYCQFLELFEGFESLEIDDVLNDLIRLRGGLARRGQSMCHIKNISLFPWPY